MAKEKPHFLLVTLGAQGHINPTLQFAKQLLQAGAHVTFATNISAHTRMDKDSLPKDLVVAALPDLCDVGREAKKERVKADGIDHAQATTDLVQSNFDHVQANLHHVQANADLVQTDFDHVQANLDHVQANINLVQTEFDHVQANLDHVQAGVELVQTDFDHVQANLDHVQDNVDLVQTDFDHVQANLDHVQAKTDLVQTDFDHIQANLDHVQAKADLVQTDFDHIQANLDHVQANVDLVQTDFDHVQTTSDHVKKSVDYVQANFDHIQASFDHDKVNADNVQAGVDFNSVQANLDHVQASFDHVNEDADYVQASANLDHVQATFDHVKEDTDCAQANANLDHVQASFDHVKEYTDCVQVSANLDHVQASFDHVKEDADYVQATANLDHVQASFDHVKEDADYVQASANLDHVQASFDHVKEDADCAQANANLDHVQASFDHVKEDVDCAQANANLDHVQATFDHVKEDADFAQASANLDHVQASSDQTQVNIDFTTTHPLSKSLADLIGKSIIEGKPITCLVYTFLLPWAAEVARKFNVPSALLWIQPATVFDVYYYYFNGHQDAINECLKNPKLELNLPNLPLQLKAQDLPSSPSAYVVAPPLFYKQLQELRKEKKPKILMNTFQALEADALMSVSEFEVISVGPLLPSATLDGSGSSDTSFGGDLFKLPKDMDYINWLDSQKKSSVIYVSFGSIFVLSKEQMKELACALLHSHRPFLWVVRETEDQLEKDIQDGKDEEFICIIKRLKQQGIIVPWCSQVEVLSHPSIGCFVTHCGWNSTLESLSFGVPMVAFPQGTDQATNAKLVEDVWKIGVRAKGESEEGLIKNEEIMRCLEMVIESKEIKVNTKKWSNMARTAVAEDGSSARNLQNFMEEIVDHYHLS